MFWLILLNVVVDELFRIVAVNDWEDEDEDVGEEDEDELEEEDEELDREDELLVTLELLVVETVDVELRVAK